MKKSCTKCKTPKHLSLFNKRKASEDGLEYICRSCKLKHEKEYKQTFKGVITTIYSSQILNSKRRNSLLPNYSKSDLKKWILAQPNFQMLWNDWVNGGYLKSLKPSCDRNDNRLPYTLNNLTLMTWQKNDDNGHRDMRLGKIINGSKPQISVIGISLKTGKTVGFHSISEASRQLKINSTSISLVCLGKPIHKGNGRYSTPRSAGGFKWKHEII